ncbi:hypothetical protein W97_08817 [Coniosporium apollinis CBS 100218]|uniref:Uncharacterized protein n=1 Tax=Coniosporium apollinis (strain CBS 100218) TaxID=1168221 RepID=R7Z5X4_CONA1|nr:uncharacterized protein W97_08817 [Coniosporium apollinis CBS 100218]EON69557.1 hypothetical protein W97_08817 [Coniosporium apollinis CBS 100218]
MSDEYNQTYAGRATSSAGRPSQGQKRQYDALRGQALTEDNLFRQQKSYRSGDIHYSKDRVYEDQTQDYNRAVYERCYPDGGVAARLDEDGRRRPQQPQAPYMAEYLRSSVELYRPPTGSSALPLERFCTPGAAAAPYPLFERMAMTEMGIKCGDMESASIRQLVAEESARSAIGTRAVQPSTSSMIVEPASTVGAQTSYGSLRVERPAAGERGFEYAGNVEEDLRVHRNLRQWTRERPGPYEPRWER